MSEKTVPKSWAQPHAKATPGFLAEHYVYEINMLRATHVLILHSVSPLLSNALMESFAIHARVLLDFFGKPGGRDDVVAAHFTTAGVIANAATAAIPISVRQRLNKQVPHLTIRPRQRHKDQPRRSPAAAEGHRSGSLSVQKRRWI